MNRKIKLLLMIFIVLVLSCDKPEPEPIVIVSEDDTIKKLVIDDTAKTVIIKDSIIIVDGGKCIYDSIDAYMVIDSIKSMEVYFSVFTKSENEWKPRVPTIPSQNWVTHVKNPDCISNNLISVGDTIPGIYMRKISKTACSPTLFKPIDKKECLYLFI